MTHRDYDPDDIIERASREIREEAIDPALEEEAAGRVWARLSKERTGVPDASGPEIVRPTGAFAGAGGAGGRIEGCAGFRNLIPVYLSGEISPARALLLEDHTHECVECRRALHEARPSKGGVVPFPGRPAETPEIVVHSSSVSRASGASSRTALRWGLAAAASVVLVLAGVTAWRMLGQSAVTGGMQVAAVQGSLYQVTASTLEPVAENAVLRAGESVRTGKESRAVVRLSDGTEVEMAERSEMAVSNRAPDTTIRLARGQIIVQAAKRQSGHLYVATDDATVAVTGTIFSVNHGTMGSRVSVIEGQVRVDQAGKEVVLGPGDQVATQEGLKRVPLAEEIAWSGNIDRYLAVVKAMTALRKDLEQAIAAPGIRHSTRLLDMMPEETFVYGAIPNVSASLGEARRRIQEQMAGNAVLSEWMTRTGRDSSTNEGLDRVLEEICAFGDQLGDEIAFSVQPSDRGAPPEILLLAEAKDPGSFRALLAETVRQANAAAPVGELLVLLPEDLEGAEAKAIIAAAASARSSAAARGEEPGYGATGSASTRTGAGAASAVPAVPAVPAGVPPKLYLWTHGGLFAAGTPAAIARSAASLSLGGGKSPFVRGAFRDRLAESYREGAGWLFSVDVEAVLAHMRAEQGGGDKAANAQAAFEKSGLLDAKQFIVNVQETNDRTLARAALTFDKPRRGMASWLAAPAPMGALGFISPDATLLAAFVVKDPALAVEDLFAVLDEADPGFAEQRAKFEAESGVDIRGDLAASLGGEFAVALDGPVLPVPASLVVVEVYDPARLQTVIEKLIATVNRHLDQPDRDGFTLETSQAGDRTFYAIRSPRSMLVLNYTYVDGYLIGAPQREMLERAIQNHQSGYALPSSAAFRNLLPENGRTNVSALFYQNGGSLFGGVARTLAGAKGLTPEQQKSVETLSAEIPAKLAVAYGEEDRIVFESSSRGNFASNFGTILGLPGGETAIAGILQQAMRRGPLGQNAGAEGNQ